MDNIPGCGGGGWTLVMKIDGNSVSCAVKSLFPINTQAQTKAQGKGKLLLARFPYHCSCRSDGSDNMETVAFATVATGAIVAIAIAEIAHVLSRRL